MKSEAEIRQRIKLLEKEVDNYLASLDSNISTELTQQYQAHLFTHLNALTWVVSDDDIYY